MFDLSRHPYFEPWQDPASGHLSYLLTARVAPLQKPFYFANSSTSADERWLWFEAAFPPSPHKTLAAVCLDPDEPVIRHFPGTVVEHAAPLIVDDGRACLFAAGDAVWQQPLEGEATLVCRLPEEYVAARHVYRLATHLTISADGRYLLLDGEVGNQWFVALGELATGEVRVLHEWGRHYNHAQFSPHDPNLFLIAQDWWRDRISGRYTCYDHRIWLMDTVPSRFEPLLPTDWFRHGTDASHEWWAPDGTLCWVDYARGAYECDVTTRETTLVWPGPLCHAHCSADRRYWCADESPYRWPDADCEVRFFDRETGADLRIASALPAPKVPRRVYHIDPHPRFSGAETWITYATTARGGQVDVALAPVAPLLAAASN